MKVFLTVGGSIGTLFGLYYLYQRQLGAISFFILAVFFFSLSVAQLTGKDKKKLKKRKSDAKEFEKAKNNRLS